MKLCECGCGLPTRPVPETDSSKNWKRGEWLRFRQHHKPPLKDRFMEKFDKTSNGCWIWNACRFQKGYGTLVKDGRAHGAHRIAWELFRGPIPKGMQVLHTCDIPPCVNPDHLFLGTNDDNMLDKAKKGRISMKLTPNQVVSIRQLASTGIRKPILAKQFGVNLRMIYRIVNREAWIHVQTPTF